MSLQEGTKHIKYTRILLNDAVRQDRPATLISQTGPRRSADVASVECSCEWSVMRDER